MKIGPTTPKSAVLQELGKRLATARKQQGLTQIQLAEEAGVGVATLRRIEDGHDAQLGSWVKLLRGLGMTTGIDALVPEVLSSPMAEVKSAGKRARRTTAPGSAPRWGDEAE